VKFKETSVGPKCFRKPITSILRIPLPTKSCSSPILIHFNVVITIELLQTFVKCRQTCSQYYLLNVKVVVLCILSHGELLKMQVPKLHFSPYHDSDSD
jgi:hypothetical protein